MFCVAVAAMTIVDRPPSEKLAAYLHQPRCAHAESLVTLGEAAFVEERSPEEFDKYRRILDADPDFAEHWSRTLAAKRWSLVYRRVLY